MDQSRVLLDTEQDTTPQELSLNGRVHCLARSSSPSSNLVSTLVAMARKKSRVVRVDASQEATRR